MRKRLFDLLILVGFFGVVGMVVLSTIVFVSNVNAQDVPPQAECASVRIMDVWEGPHGPDMGMGALMVKQVHAVVTSLPTVVVEMTIPQWPDALLCFFPPIEDSL